MPSVFLTADNHWGHNGVCFFTKADGSKLRPWTNSEDMDEAMVALWNSTVGPKDKVYCLGDWAIRRGSIKTAERLNGDKVLIKGNHDIFKLHDYTSFFRDIRAYHVMDKYILSHIPVHKSQSIRFKGNIHGHLHSNRVMDNEVIDPWYHCVSVEHTDFKPILFEQVRKYFENIN
jgi:calcineurin-like phosphoesterase family protein